jgi:hypothetical protein
MSAFSKVRTAWSSIILPNASAEFRERLQRIENLPDALASMKEGSRTHLSVKSLYELIPWTKLTRAGTLCASSFLGPLAVFPSGRFLDSRSRLLGLGNEQLVGPSLHPLASGHRFAGFTALEFDLDAHALCHHCRRKKIRVKSLRKNGLKNAWLRECSFFASYWRANRRAGSPSEGASSPLLPVRCASKLRPLSHVIYSSARDFRKRFERRTPGLRHTAAHSTIFR